MRGSALLLRDFVNTYERQLDDERVGDPRALASWLVEHGLLPAGSRLTAHDVRRAHELREGLREVLQAHAGHRVDPERVAALEEVLADVPLRVVFAADGSSALAAVRPRPYDQAVARLLDAVRAAREEGTWERLKVCARDSCRWAFLDTSRNRSGRWCSMSGCGNQVKMRRAYARRRHLPTRPE